MKSIRGKRKKELVMIGRILIILLLLTCSLGWASDIKICDICKDKIEIRVYYEANDTYQGWYPKTVCNKCVKKLLPDGDMFPDNELVSQPAPMKNVKNDSCLWYFGIENCIKSHVWEAGVIDNFVGISTNSNSRIDYPDTNPSKFEYCRLCGLYKATYKNGIKYWRDRHYEYQSYSWYAGSAVDVPFTK